MPELPPGTQPRILCYGDSLTAGLTGNFVLKYEPYAKTLQKLMGCDVDHVGLSGWTTQQMVEIAHDKTATDVKDREWKDAGLAYRLEKAYKKNRAYTCVIIMAGTNDLGELPPEKIAANLMTLHNYARDVGAVSVACAIPKHGALVSQHYAEKMGESSVKRLKKLVHNANLAIKAAVQVTNDQGTDACQITFCDVHHEMLKWTSGTEEELAGLYAGFPTLGDYRDFMMSLCEQRSVSDEDVEKMTKNFEGYSDEDFKKRINETKEGKRIKKAQPKHYATLEDSLHFSAEGYKLFAEALHSKVFARDGGRTVRDRRSGGGSLLHRKSNSTESAGRAEAAEAHRPSPERTQSFWEKDMDREGKHERRSASMKDVTKSPDKPERERRSKHRTSSGEKGESEVAARGAASPVFSGSDVGTPSSRTTPDLVPTPTSAKHAPLSPTSPAMAWKSEEKERGSGLLGFMMKSSREPSASSTTQNSLPEGCAPPPHYGCIPVLNAKHRK